MSLTPLLIHSPGISGLISKVMGLVSVSLTSFPGGSVVKYLPGYAKYVGSIPGSRRFPRRRKWQATPVFLPGKSHGQRSLVGCSPGGHKELNKTEQLSMYEPLR